MMTAKIKGKLIQTIITEDLYIWVRSEAKSREISQAAFLRQIVREARARARAHTAAPADQSCTQCGKQWPLDMLGCEACR